MSGSGLKRIFASARGDSAAADFRPVRINLGWRRLAKRRVCLDCHAQASSRYGSNPPAVASSASSPAKGSAWPWCDRLAAASAPWHAPCPLVILKFPVASTRLREASSRQDASKASLTSVAQLGGPHCGRSEPKPARAGALLGVNLNTRPKSHATTRPTPRVAGGADRSGGRVAIQMRHMPI